MITISWPKQLKIGQVVMHGTSTYMVSNQGPMRIDKNGVSYLTSLKPIGRSK